MTRLMAVLAVATALAGCDGNPLVPDPDPDPGTGTPTTPEEEEEDGGIGGDDALPPGTASPTPTGGIVRYEAANEDGGSFVTEVTYNAADDTFEVDNLAFDGDNVYQRDGDVGSLGPFAVYENDDVALDYATGTPIPQIEHKAIYGVSTNRGRTRFAIVRSGGYIGYGFGGFVYQRNEGVEFPTTGQATFTGDYAGLRVFNGRGGIEYATGDATIDIDFEDFNDPTGVRGRIENRQVYDTAGRNLIDEGVLTRNDLPVIRFRVSPGAFDENGEITGTAASSNLNDAGEVQDWETGTYYAVLAGPDADEIVGVVVVESQDPVVDGSTVQETGGFIVYR